MGSKRSLARARRPAPDSVTQVREGGESRVDRWRGLLADVVAGVVVGPFVRLIAAFILGAAGVFLTVMWQMAPQKEIDYARYSKFTTRTLGKIVESWVAVTWNPAEMRKDSINWRGYAKASPCVVVEYSGAWDGSMRRAFCGRSFVFRDYTLHDLREISPATTIPFVWVRDASGFIVPEIRLGPGRREWLASHPPASTFGLKPPLPQTALDALRWEFDRPVEFAIAGWSQPAPEFPLALDSSNPAEALPVASVNTLLGQPRHWGNWIIAGVLAPFALALWFLGMSLLLGGLPRAAATFIAVLALLALPWWGGEFAHYLRSLNKDLGGVFTEILGDVENNAGVAAFEPAEATLIAGERLVWHAGDGIYADTFGSLRYTLPNPAPNSADAALAALVTTATDQVRGLDAARQTEFFARLKRDKLSDRRGAGLIFMRAARDTLLDAHSDATLRRAATAFLEAWVTQPVEAPQKGALAFHERQMLFGELVTLDNDYVANPARSLAGLASGK